MNYRSIDNNGKEVWFPRFADTIELRRKEETPFSDLRMEPGDFILDRTLIVQPRDEAHVVGLRRYFPLPFLLPFDFTWLLSDAAIISRNVLPRP